MLPGEEGHIVCQALSEKEASFPQVPTVTRPQRMADSLVAVCLDSLTGTGDEGREVTVAEVFVDATLAAPTRESRG